MTDWPDRVTDLTPDERRDLMRRDPNRLLEQEWRERNPPPPLIAGHARAEFDRIAQQRQRRRRTARWLHDTFSAEEPPDGAV